MLPPGGSVWEPTRASEIVAENRALQNHSLKLNAIITAIGGAGNTVYAGGSDGRIWVSTDSGQNFGVVRDGGGSPVERFFVDPTDPRVALAVMKGKGPRVLRTTLTGALWDAMDGNLPDTPVTGITADRAAGAIYVATGKGVFYAHADLTGLNQDSGSLDQPLRPPSARRVGRSGQRCPAGPGRRAALCGH